MFLEPITQTKLLAVTLAAGWVATSASPLDGWGRLAVEAPLVAVIALLLLRTMPQLTAEFREALKEVRAEIRDLAQAVRDNTRRPKE